VNATIAVCQRCASPIEAGDLRCAICSQTCPAVLPSDRPETAVDILRCSSCGAAVAYDVTTRTPTCAFCGSVLELEHSTDPMEQAGETLPFRIDRTRALTALRGWLGSLGWFRPADLLSTARLESIRPLWWVAWVFDAEASVAWTADSDAGAAKSEWAPHSGTVDFELDDIVVSASRGLTAAEAAQLASSYDLQERDPNPASDHAPVGVENATTERFDVSRSVARQHVVKAIERLADSRLRQGHVPGARVRNLHTAILLRRLSTRRCALPAWVMAYRYKGRLYRFVLSGHDQGCQTGTAPYSKAKIAATVAVGVGGLVVLVLLLGALLG
jgi:hypothetical protein